MKAVGLPLALALVLSGTASAEGLQAPTPAPQPAPAASAAPKANTLQDGTAVKLRLTENLTSATAKAGQQVSFEVLEEVDVDGLPVIAKGAQALATITTAETKKSMGRGGKLDVNVDSVRLIDGEKAALSATRSDKGGGHQAAMATGMVATAVIFFPAAPLLLFVHGKDITIPEGTEITAFIAGDLKLDMARFAPQPPPSTAQPAAAAPTMASLTVDSSAPGADIEVDGTFVGNTPSTLSVTPGQHTIAVKKNGYTDWSRTMTVAGSGVHLNADLDKTP